MKLNEPIMPTGNNIKLKYWKGCNIDNIFIQLKKSKILNPPKEK